jgi:hypothetical protein
MATTWVILNSQGHDIPAAENGVDVAVFYCKGPRKERREHLTHEDASEALLENRDLLLD